MKRRLYPERFFYKLSRRGRTCLVCQEHFSDATELAVHSRLHYAKKRCNLTKECDFEASEEHKMARHVMEEHYRVKSTCSICGSASRKHQCSVDPSALVGQRISVKWNEGWFDGTVEKVNRVRYDEEPDKLYEEALEDRFWRFLPKKIKI